MNSRVQLQSAVGVCRTAEKAIGHPIPSLGNLQQLPTVRQDQQSLLHTIRNMHSCSCPNSELALPSRIMGRC